MKYRSRFKDESKFTTLTNIAQIQHFHTHRSPNTDMFFLSLRVHVLVCALHIQNAYTQMMCVRKQNALCMIHIANNCRGTCKNTHKISIEKRFFFLLLWIKQFFFSSQSNRIAVHTKTSLDGKK